MDARNTRKTLVERTLNDLRSGFYVRNDGRQISIDQEVKQAVEGASFYPQEALAALLAQPRSGHASQQIQLVRSSTIACLVQTETRESRVALLNFASAKNPGGGFMGGSQAQEESLARSSSLYPSLMAHPAYYAANRRAGDTFYNSNLIYSPQVVFFVNDAGQYLDEYKTADVITMPAVNKGALSVLDDDVQRRIDEVMMERIRYVLAVSEQHHVDTLILGAWGCGVFRNHPEDIARNFRDVLREKPGFNIPNIVFAILDRDGKTYEVFHQMLLT